MNPVGTTTDTSCGTDLHRSENRQNMLADLRPSSPGPPRAAAVAHQLLQSANRRFFAMHPALPDGNDAAAGQAPPRQEEPLHDLSGEHMMQALDTGVHARFECMPPSPSYRWNLDAVLSSTGLAHAYPPEDEHFSSAGTTGQIGAPPFGEALGTSSSQASMAFGDEYADLLDFMVNHLMSDDYEAFDPEESNILALMADNADTIPDTIPDTLPPTGLAHAYPPEGEHFSSAGTTRQIGAPPFGEALETPSSQASMAFGDEYADLLDFVVNHLMSDDYEAFDPEESNILALMADNAATIPDTGPDKLPPTGLAQEHPPGGESLSPAGTTGQIGASLFGEALGTSSSQASMAFGDEYADLLDFVVNHLMSDDYEAFDPEESNIRALMADNAATIPDTGPDKLPPTGPAQEHPPVGGSPGPGPAASQTDAPSFGGTLEAPSGQATMAFGDESADQFDFVVNHLLSDDYEAFDPEASNVRALMADYEASVLNTDLDTGAAPSTGQIDAIPLGESAARPAEPSADPDHTRGKQRANSDSMVLDDKQRQAILHFFETDPERSIQSIADEFGVSYSTIRTLKMKFWKTGNIKAGDRANRLTDDQRRAILSIFETDPERSNQSIVDEFGVAYTTVLMLRRRFRKTGNIKAGDSAKRLTDDQRRAVLHIFKTEPERNSQSIADEFDVNTKTIRTARRQFSKTGTIKPRNISNRLTGNQRLALLHIFKTEPERSSQSIADEFDVSIRTIQTSRRQFGKTGSIKAGDSENRLTEDQRRTLLHIFRTDPQRSSQSIVDEFGVAYATIQVLRKRFNNTGNLKPKDRVGRLTGDQRRAIAHIFKTDPERSNQSIADEFGLGYSTVQVLRKRFRKAGNIKPGDHANRLSKDQRRAIVHIFETDPERSSQRIADEFAVSLSTIKRLRKKFYKTGDIEPGDRANRLTGDQRRAIVHIFKTDPERSNQSIASEFGVNLKTILSSRKKFGKTGTIKPGDYTKRLTDDERRLIVHIFETDPERSNQRIADEFAVSLATIKRLREKFAKTGDIKPGDLTRRLTEDQRQAIVHIFETDPERSTQRIADEFSVNFQTIQKLREKFAKTGDIKPGDRKHRLTGDQHRAIVHIFETDSKRSIQSIAVEFGVTYSTIYKLRRRFIET